MSADFFNYGIVILFGILVVFLSWASYKLVKTLEKVDLILAEIKGVTDELEIFKSGIKMGLITLISALISKLKEVSDVSDDNKNSTMGKVSSVVAGMAVGAAAGAAAVFLSDDKKRKELSKKAHQVVDDLKAKAATMTDKVEEKMEEGKEMLAKKLEEAAKKLSE